MTSLDPIKTTTTKPSLLFCFFSLSPNVMVKSDEASEALAAAAADTLVGDTLQWGKRWTTIQRNPALTVYLTLLCSAGGPFSRLTAWAIVAKLMAAAEAMLSRPAAEAAAAAAAALAPDSQ